MLGIQEMTVLVIYVIKVSGLFLRTYKFPQFVLYSKVLELELKITELTIKVKCYMLFYDNALLIC